MKKTSKAVALLLAATMTMGMAFSAFAENSVNPTFKKNYIIENSGTTSPAEIFTFKFEAVAVKKNNNLTKDDMPAIPDKTTEFAALSATTENTIEVELNNINWPGVGVYYYKVTEKAPETKTAGVTYSNAEKYLKVTVANTSDGSGKYYVAFVTLTDLSNPTGDEDVIDANKSDSFENKYSAVKNLEISKTVEGALGSKDEYFEIKVTLNNPEGEKAPDSYTVSGGSYSGDAVKEGTTANPTSITAGTKTTFYIKHGETLNIANVPYGVTYTVEETSAEGYTATFNGKANCSDEKVDSSEEKVSIVNTKSGTIDTGVILDNAPYVILAAVAVLGLAMVMKRHNIEQ